MTLRDAIARVVERGDLSEAEMASAVGTILSGEATSAQIAAFLVALRMKGETDDELTGAARAMRAHATPLPGASPEAVDTCGTGGDGASTLNVSTAAGLVVAGAGVPVAKHGNRAVSGTVGGADVLEALGVRIELPPEDAAACLREVGFAFLFAPAFHPALRYAAAARREIGVRTMFNLLGPLTNPAGVRRQVIGVFDVRRVEPVARVLLRLGAERAWVVHGAGGLDELSLEGESTVAEVRDGAVTVRTMRATDVGLAATPASALRVADVRDAAARLEAILGGERGPARDLVCLNAAAVLVVAGAAPDLPAGIAKAAAAIDSGAAAAVLARVAAFTTACGAAVGARSAG